MLKVLVCMTVCLCAYTRVCISSIKRYTWQKRTSADRVNDSFWPEWPEMIANILWKPFTTLLIAVESVCNQIIIGFSCVVPVTSCSQLLQSIKSSTRYWPEWLHYRPVCGWWLPYVQLSLSNVSKGMSADNFFITFYYFEMRILYWK